MVVYVGEQHPSELVYLYFYLSIHILSGIVKVNCVSYLDTVRVIKPSLYLSTITSR